jgi:acyl-coenzyme A synthetase/AMP-(fatty) acid ligase
MKGFSTVPDKTVSHIRGTPLEEEPGLGTLTLPGFIREVTGQYGPREAVVQRRPGDAVERWTYDNLWARSMEVSRALVACGLGKGERVGILMTNRVEFLSAVFGTALAGGTTAILSTFSTPAELDHLIASSACSVLLLEPKVLKKNFVHIITNLAPEVAAAARASEIASVKYPFLRHIVSLDCHEPVGGFEPWERFLARGAGVSDGQVNARAAAVTPADPGVLFFSSGTTGKPKGIQSSNRGVSIQLWRWRRIFGLRDDVRCWTANGFFWSGPFGMAIGCALGSGGTLVLQSTFDPEEALGLLEAERVSLPLAWPHQWAELEAAANWNDVDLSAMRYVAAENPISKHPTVKANWPEPTRIYGNTETFTLSSAYPSGTPKEVIGDSWGFPLPGMEFKIVDPFTGKVMPMGERGEIAVKGPTLMLGYVGVPLDETLDHEGYFRTGDGGYVDPVGRLYWEGRLNDIIKTGGANVSPVEVDAVLIQCPGVRLTQTVGVPDDLLGELVVACIVLQEGAEMDEETVRAFTRKQLASYKVPRRVLFLSGTEISKTGSAKVKTAELRKFAAERLNFAK